MKILLALSLLALVGCASQQPTLQGVRFNADGAMVNSEHIDLYRVKLSGEMWTHGKRINLMPFKIAYWPSGEKIEPQWRMSTVDSVTLYGRCDEGNLELVFPDNSPFPENSAVPDNSPFPDKRATQSPDKPVADKSGWKDGVPPCYQCGRWHWPDKPHGGWK